jgi:amino acid adenylation domain-containing protein
MTTLSIAHGGPQGPAPAASGDTPLEWFHAWAARQPDAPAVVSTEARLSYGELDAAATSLARQLADRIPAGALVGVCLDRSPALVTVAITLAKLGAVYLPLGANPAKQLLGEFIDQGAVTALVTGAAATVPESWNPHTTTTSVHQGLALPPVVVVGHARRAGTASVARLYGETPFYAVATSGTTGARKVILVREAGLANLVRWYAGDHQMGPGARVGLLAAPTFDPHLKELWSALCSGAALYVAPEEARLSAAELFRWWSEDEITSCNLPTPLAELALARPWPAGLALRHLSIGGDRMRTRPPANCTAAVVNEYGPAEATCTVSSYRVGAGQVKPGAPILIGAPISGVTVFVTDENGTVLPRGEAGELRVGGAGLALGYLDQALTAERFVPGPRLAGTQFADGIVYRTDGIVYRTGDRVRMDADGLLEFIGRLDDQVKISGVRIEPAEVEAAIKEHPAVAHAVAIAVPVAGGERRLVAFAQPASTPPDPADVLAFAAERLIAQAVPSSLLFIDSFPINENGKVDRSRLTVLATEGTDDHASAGSNGVAGNATQEPGRLRDRQLEPEEFLVTTVRELLGVSTLGPEDNFFAAGGTSLAAARLLAVIEATYDIRVNAAEVMRQPSLSALAALVARHAITAR